MIKKEGIKRISIFASGKGSNAEAITAYFSKRKDVAVTHVFSNNKKAGVLTMAHKKGIKTNSFDRQAFYNSDKTLNDLRAAQPDLVVLAGFMWMMPESFLAAFPNKLINIHPSLLPKYGGKGMYGQRVHQAVVDHKEKETGISIHYVNEHYDEGKLIAQFKTPIHREDNLDDIVEKIKKLEHKHYPKVIDNLLFPEH